MTSGSGEAGTGPWGDWAEEWSRTDTETRYEQRGRSCTFCLAPAASPYEWPTDHAEDCPRRDRTS